MTNPGLINVHHVYGHQFDGAGAPATGDGRGMKRRGLTPGQDLCICEMIRSPFRGQDLMYVNSLTGRSSYHGTILA